VAEVPTARSGITAGVIGTTIYVAGGEGPGGTFPTNEAYQAEPDQWRTTAPMPTGRHGLASAVINGKWYVIGGGPAPGGSFSNLNEVFTPANRPSTQSSDKLPHTRAGSKQVGAVMALLAVFEDAGVLPPESTPEANRLIKGLIQFQAAFMRSGNPALRTFMETALREQLGEEAPVAAEAFRRDGWTSTSLDAVVRYAASHHPWHQAELVDGFREFNVGPADFEMMARTYQDAQRKLENRGQNFHAAYAARRREMPGAGM
jgi:hypothetical protein